MRKKNSTFNYKLQSLIRLKIAFKNRNTIQCPVNVKNCLKACQQSEDTSRFKHYIR